MTGTMPRPSLPVLSAMSCSSQAANGRSRGGTRKVSLSAPRSAAEPRTAPRRAPGFSAAVSTRHAAAAALADESRRPRSMPLRAAGRSPKAERAEKRPPMSDRPWKIRRNRSDAASVSRGLAGSVMATNRSPGGGFAEGPDGPLVEEGEERDQLGGRARFRGNEEERPAKIQPGRRIGHGAGFGRVEDLELEAACRRGERAGEDLGGQARAAHAQDDGPDEPFAADGGREGLHVRDAGPGCGGGVQPAEAVGDLPAVGLPDRRVPLPDASDDGALVEAAEARREPGGQAPRIDDLDLAARKIHGCLPLRRGGL